MLHLNPKEQLVGKTIESIDSSCVNVWVVKFTDGTSYEIHAEQAINTGSGQIPGMTLWWHDENEK